MTCSMRDAGPNSGSCAIKSCSSVTAKACLPAALAALARRKAPGMAFTTGLAEARVMAVPLHTLNEVFIGSRRGRAAMEAYLQRGADVRTIRWLYGMKSARRATPPGA